MKGILVTKLDRIIFAVLLLLIISSKEHKQNTRLFLMFSLILISVSVILFMVNSPFGNLTYYVEKLSLWSYLSFVVGIMNIVIVEIYRQCKKY